MGGYGDEATIRNPHDSYHHNGWRKFVWTFVLVCFMSLVLGSVFDLSFIPIYVLIVATLCLALILGHGARRLVKGKAPKAPDVKAAEMQAQLEAEKEKKLADAKASGAFDRWEK